MIFIGHASLGAGAAKAKSQMRTKPSRARHEHCTDCSRLLRLSVVPATGVAGGSLGPTTNKNKKKYQIRHHQICFSNSKCTKTRFQLKFRPGPRSPRTIPLPTRRLGSQAPTNTNSWLCQWFQPVQHYTSPESQQCT